MSSSNSSRTDLANDIAYMTVFIQIWSICLITFGVIGHALSIYVFTRRQFRSNPCARYFLASTISGCTVVYFLTPLRLLQNGYNIDVFIYSLPVCQILSYLFSWFRILPSWFIVLASIDRFLCSSSSVSIRGWSNLRVASRSILITTLLTGLAYIHAPFNQAILLSPLRSCTYSTSAYRAFFSIWNLVVWSWIPSICMLIFGSLTIRHVRQGKRRVAAQNDALRIKKKLDRQLIQMLLLQCVVFTSTTTAGSISQLYVSIANNITGKNDLERLRDRYIGYIGNSIALFGPCMSFYLFTISSQLFRREMVKLICQRRPVEDLPNSNANPIEGTR